MHDFTFLKTQFGINGVSVPYGNGHINHTYHLCDATGTSYIIQKISTAAFSEPEKLMENIVAVTKHLCEKIREQGGNHLRETLTVCQCIDGKPFYKAPDGSFWRVYLYITGTKALETAETPEVFAEAGRAFARFASLLSDFPANKLHTVIPNFHNTPERLRQLREAVCQDRFKRASEVQPEIDFALRHETLAQTVIDAIEAGEIPLRVTHNDTKLNNVLFDAESGKAQCVIDLDTVMPGSLLYDYGDALRFGASSAAEDEQDLAKVYFRLPYYRAYTEAYLSEMGDNMTEGELSLMPIAAPLLTLECGMRFLTDYLNGDTYFQTSRPKQNLDRCRTQFRLVADMEEKQNQMRDILNEALHNGTAQ